MVGARAQTENTAKWLTEAAAGERQLGRAAELDRIADRFESSSLTALATAVRQQTAGLRALAGRWSISPGQLVIIDEASLAGTLTLASIADQARGAKAKVVLVGDWAQLSAVQAGGAFGMLIRDRPWVPELTAVRRFANAWERDASTRLRAGDPTVISEYQRRGAINEGDRAQMIDAAYLAWSADEASKLRSLLIASDNATVRDLNARARADRVSAGAVEPGGVLLHDGSTAGRGDRVVARRNERQLSTGPGWVKNGDQFDVVHRRTDGSLRVRGTSGSVLVLPAAYVREDLELAYATTAHRAQGMAVDTAHLLVTGPAMTREVLPVGMTRGREVNRAYVCTDLPIDEYDLTQDAPSPRGAEVLASVLSRTSTELSAHETARAEHDRQTTIAVLAAQYDTIASQAEDQRWKRLLETAGATRTAEARSSNEYRSLMAACRYADALGLDVDAAVPHLVAIQPLPIGLDERMGETCDPRRALDHRRRR